MIEKSLKIYQSTKNKINALSYAMYMINWDSETEAPVGCLEERSKQLGNITEMIVSLSHKKTYVNALKDIIANKDFGYNPETKIKSIPLYAVFLINDGFKQTE